MWDWEKYRSKAGIFQRELKISLFVSGDSSSIVIVEWLIKSLITSGPKYTVMSSINKDSKSRFGPESNDNWLSYEWY